jgi:hypothetical protein
MESDSLAPTISVNRRTTGDRTDVDGKHILVIDTGGGHISTITKAACLVLHRTNHCTELIGYQDKSSPKRHPIVHCAIKVNAPNIDTPIILVLNYVSLLEDEDETESLLQPFSCMRHGIRMDMTPVLYGGESGMRVDGQFIAFEFDKEKLFLSISKPTWEDMDYFDIYELTSPYDPEVLSIVHPRRNKKRLTYEDIPIPEWRRRLGMLPEDIIRRTMDCTTQYYMNAEIENRQNPRDHIKSRFPGLRMKRQNEAVASDTFFPDVVSNRGNTCSQFFTTLTSDRWDVYPLKTESQNGAALQDYTRKVGAPTVLKTDNAQSELSSNWTQHLRNICTASETTEPHHPWQNPAERKIGALGAMVRNAMREFKVPLSRHDYCQKWCCDVHNVVANRKLGWRSPLELNTGSTPDISKFRFHIWEPIWYYEPSKQPNDNLKKARWLGFADSSGDAFTYLIEPEDQKGPHRKVLIRSNIKTRRKNIGKENEFIDDNPNHAEFFLTPAEADVNLDEQYQQSQNEVSVSVDPVNGTTESPPEHASPSSGEQDLINTEGLEDDLVGLTPETMGQIYDQFQSDQIDETYTFHSILTHEFRDGTLIFKVRYKSHIDNGEYTLEIPFPILKTDEPINVARYIRDHVLEDKRNGYYNQWAKATLRNHSRCIRRLFSITKSGEPIRIRRANTSSSKKKLSRNARNARRETREKFGIRIPNNIQEALEFDRQNGNTKWGDAIQKELAALQRLDCFEFIAPDTTLHKSDGWQYAPMHMIFDIKQEDLRYKARLVMGGHVVDSSQHTTYSSTISDISVRLLMLVATQNNLNLMVGDVGNAFPTAPCAEKIWSTAGPEFRHQGKEGSKVILKRALYGLKTASRSFHEFFGDKLRRMGFVSSRADQDLWVRRSDDYKGYDYIATHVDDLIIAAKNPGKYMNDIEQEFLIRNKSDSPSYYLGNDMKSIHNNKYMHISTKKYVTEVIRKFRQTYGDIRKESVPMPPKAHPELDDSRLLNHDEVKQFQHIIGVAQWLVVAGRFDINYAVSSLSRFASAPREGHLYLARKLFGYLRKYPNKGYTINPAPPKIDAEYQKVTLKQDFGGQYHYFNEELDPKFPEPLLKELDVNMFCDSDHGHDKVTGRSITGIICFVGSTPVIWESKRQTCVQTSTFGAEFTALKRAVEKVVMIRYHLRSMGVPVSKATSIWVDNMSVILNATNPGSSLNKKHVALAYHFVREHVANDVVEIRKIDSIDNYADPFTKALNSTEFHNFFRELQT